MRKIKETIADIPWLLEEWDYEKNAALGIFPDKVASQSNSKAYWKCKFGHKWEAKISNRYHGRGCPECRKRLKTSFPEQALFYYVRKKFPDAINSYKDIFDHGMELDIYVPSQKVGVEYDGIAWHKDESLEKERHKYEICKRHSIFLIRVKENRDHWKLDSDVADVIIPMRKPFSSDRSKYFNLNKIIREVLRYLFDYDVSQLFFSPSPDSNPAFESIFGPKVNTDVNSRRDQSAIYENYLVNYEHNSMGELFPETAKMWHPTKNGELTPYMFSPHSAVCVWWRGECGHEWENPITVMTRGYACPFCAGQKVLKGFNDLPSKYPEIAAQWHPTANGSDCPDMFTFGSGHSAYWLCPTCGQTWKTSISNRTLAKTNCPYCAHEKPIKGVNDLVTIRPQLISEWDYEKNTELDPSEFLPNSNKTVWWTCSKCGYSYKASIINRNKGTGCARCAGQILISGKNDLATLFPEVAKEWDYDENKGLEPSQVFAQSNKKYHWVCRLGHKWEAAPNSRALGRGCPYCAGNKVWIGFNDLATTNPEIAARWHPTLNGDKLPTTISKGYARKVWLLCPDCGNAYDTYIGNIIKGYGACPYCSPRKTRAKAVYQVETGLYFKTLKAAAQSCGNDEYRKIHKCCKGQCKTAFGYHWEYRDFPAQNNGDGK